MIKGYLMAVLTVLSVAFVYGLLVPSLVSAKSDVALLIGLFMAFGFPVIGLIAGRRYINSLKNLRRISNEERHIGDSTGCDLYDGP